MKTATSPVRAPAHDSHGSERLAGSAERGTKTVALLGVFAALVVGCAPGVSAPATATGRLLSQPGETGKLTAVLPSSDLAVGANQRFLLALIGPDNRPVTDATVELAFFKVTGPSQAQLRSQAVGTFYGSPALSAVGRGVYVARTDFNEAGDWGVALGVTRPGEESTELRVSFSVKERSATPAVGQPAPLSRTLTATTTADVERFCSARPGDDFHQLSIDQALAQRRPLVALFATPGFCTSRVCGPSLDVLTELHQEYGDRANFVHVEIYKDGRPNEKQEMVSTVQEWGLPSEPWLFIVDGNGRVAEKFEGGATVEEVSPMLARVLGSG